MNLQQKLANGVLPVLLLIGALGCEQKAEEAGDLQIVGKASSGEVKILPFPIRRAFGKLQKSIQHLDRETLALMEQDRSGSPFELSRVTVGLEIELEGEIEGLFEIAGEGVLELRYERLPEGV